MLLVTTNALAWGKQSDLWQTAFQQGGFRQEKDLLDHLAQLGQPLKLSSEVCHNCLRGCSRGASCIRALVGPQLANDMMAV